MPNRLPIRLRPALVLGTSAALFAACGYVFGQASAPKPYSENKRMQEWALGVTSAELDAQIYAMKPDDKTHAGGVDKLVSLYKKAGRDSELSDAALHLIAARQLEGSTAARSAEQANQVSGEASVRLQMLQIAQNQRIIELLEKIAAKR